ncbi:hypothetical protein KKF91_06435 [Myxococcota bacterium]|nr:hypothetical protein [Myxococcota bacterium]
MHPNRQHKRRPRAWRCAITLKLKLMLWAALILSGGCLSEAEPTSDAGAMSDVEPKSDAELGPCLAFEGAWRVEGEGDYLSASPWLMLRVADDACEATVACEGFAARPYSAQREGGALELRPLNEAAEGGARRETTHTLTDWSALRIDASGVVSAEVINRYNAEDVWSDVAQSLEGLQLKPPASGALKPSPPRLPWGAFTLTATSPAEGIAEALRLPEGWSAEDQRIEGAVGVHAATLRFAGGWDAIRGQRIAIEGSDALRDLAGAPLESGALEVLDIGPAVERHEAEGDTTLAVWGDSKLREGPCAEGACVAYVTGFCERGGAAGQLNTQGKTQVALELLFERGDITAPEVIMFGPDLRPLEAAREVLSEAPQVERWTWEVAGLDRVAFAVEVMMSCHGWNSSPIQILSAEAR